MQEHFKQTIELKKCHTKTPIEFYRHSKDTAREKENMAAK